MIRSLAVFTARCCDWAEGGAPKAESSSSCLDCRFPSQPLEAAVEAARVEGEGSGNGKSASASYPVTAIVETEGNLELLNFPDIAALVRRLENSGEDDELAAEDL